MLQILSMIRHPSKEEQNVMQQILKEEKVIFVIHINHVNFDYL